MTQATIFVRFSGKHIGRWLTDKAGYCRYVRDGACRQTGSGWEPVYPREWIQATGGLSDKR